MGHSQRFALFVTLGLSFVCIGSPALALPVGNNPSGSHATVAVPSAGLGSPAMFAVTADLTYDPSAGSLYTDFTNTTEAAGVAPGVPMSISETFINTSSAALRSAGEGFFDISVARVGGGTAPGFLFDPASIVVRKNGGLLAADIDYVLTGTAYSDSANNGWSSMKITFAPGQEIGVGETLGISKSFARTAGLTNPNFDFGAVARVEQSITLVPEPTTAAVFAGSVSVLCRRRRR